MVELLDLPNGVLELIAAKATTGSSHYEESWGAAAASCRRLHDVQLSSEYVEAKGLQSASSVRKEEAKMLYACRHTLGNRCHQVFLTPVFAPVLPDYVSPAGLPWLMPRLNYAKALRITIGSSTKDACATIHLLHEIEKLLGSAASNLPRLQVLVSDLLDAQLGQHSLLELPDAAVKQTDSQAAVLCTGIFASCEA